jgi:hypothetical protein
MVPGYQQCTSVAKFIVPNRGVKVDSSIRMSVVPARKATEAGGTVRQPYADVNYIPQSGTMNLATEQDRITLRA